MAKQWTMPFLPAKEGNKLLATYVDTGSVPVADDNITIYIGDDVPFYPQSTYIDGWIWLYNGVVDRLLLDGPFNGAVLYTGADYQNLTANNRRTESLIASFTTTDVVIGLGLNVTATGSTVMLQNAVYDLVDFARSETLVFV
jgi:hypothetical protein